MRGTCASSWRSSRHGEEAVEASTLFWGARVCARTGGEVWKRWKPELVAVLHPGTTARADQRWHALVRRARTDWPPGGGVQAAALVQLALELPVAHRIARPRRR